MCTSARVSGTSSLTFGLGKEERCCPTFSNNLTILQGFSQLFCVKLSAKRELANIFAIISVCTCHSFKTAKTQQSLNSWVEAVRRDQRGSMTQGSFDCYQIVCSVCIRRTCSPSLLKTETLSISPKLRANLQTALHRCEYAYTLFYCAHSHEVRCNVLK